jgi:aspartate kinase
MKVFKFGGASVRDASGIRNLFKIVSGEKANLVVVVSAFAKTTNALENVLDSWISGDDSFKVQLGKIRDFHFSVCDELFGEKIPLKEDLADSFGTLANYLTGSDRSNYDMEYDQIVSYGEIWSTMIVEGYLSRGGLETEWVDIRKLLVTDERFRDANVNWDESSERIKKVFHSGKKRIIVTQGFIAGTFSGLSTTLGREGSDYTAAILANILDADTAVVWKDVPGILNADPGWMPDAGKLEEMSYREAVEISFSGAKVIHPKTIKPLQNKNIPLYVKSFESPDEPGTVIKGEPVLSRMLPVYIKREKQLLISILPKDFSFVIGENLGRIFHIFNRHKINVNVVEASAVSIDVCIDDERTKVESLTEELKPEFDTFYNEGLELLSIRHYTPESVQMITAGMEILMEQRTRSSVRFVARSKSGHIT